MMRHIVLMLTLTVAALAGGIAMIPGPREQWTVLMRDGRDAQALQILEAHYYAGEHDPDAELHLYRLLMSFAETERATRVIERLVAENPDSVMAVALLARHYADLQNRRGETGALRRLYELSPSIETAHRLLAIYRIDGAFDREEKLLTRLLADDLISANDAERLGLMLAAQGKFAAAREALLRLDQIANPERTVGRLALFDVLVRLGDKTSALAKAAAWIPNWRKAVVRNPGTETPAARLVRMMLAVDEPETRRIVCDIQRSEPAANARALGDITCEPTGPAADPAGAIN